MRKKSAFCICENKRRRSVEWFSHSIHVLLMRDNGGPVQQINFEVDALLFSQIYSTIPQLPTSDMSSLQPFSAAVQ